MDIKLIFQSKSKEVVIDLREISVAQKNIPEDEGYLLYFKGSDNRVWIRKEDVCDFEKLYFDYINLINEGRAA